MKQGWAEDRSHHFHQNKTLEVFSLNITKKRKEKTLTLMSSELFSFKNLQFMQHCCNIKKNFVLTQWFESWKLSYFCLGVWCLCVHECIPFVILFYFLTSTCTGSVRQIRTETPYSDSKMFGYSKWKGTLAAECRRIGQRIIFNWRSAGVFKNSTLIQLSS